MKNYTLGIDAGSVAIAIVLINENNQIIYSSYTFHKGRIREKLTELFNEIQIEKVGTIGYTSSTPSMINHGKQVDSRIAFITSVKHFHPGVRSLLIIGAEKFGLVTFDENGEYRNYKSNTSCAAGTGNFLDQQAERLNLKGIHEFSELAYNNSGSFPKIASRCAVFAKTDLIHAQQEGYSLSEICDGLSFGLAKNIVDTVFHNHSGIDVVAAGGVALNKAVIRHMESLAGLNIKVGNYAHLYGAIGAALLVGMEENKVKMHFNKMDDILSPEKRDKKYFHPPLRLNLSDYPEFKQHHTYEFHSLTYPKMKTVEVDVYYPTRNVDLGRMFLGIDIGSTSTKAVLLNGKKEVIAGFYTRTSGQPVQAVQVIFEAISNFSVERNIRFSISGAGTTGSG